MSRSAFVTAAVLVWCFQCLASPTGKHQKEALRDLLVGIRPAMDGKDFGLEAIAFFQEGKLTSWPSVCEETPSLTRLESKYFRPGQKFKLVTGYPGSEVAVLGRDKEFGEIVARIEADIHLRPEDELLATNSKAMIVHVPYNRPPTSVEAKLAREQVGNAFGKHGIGQSELNRISIEQLVVTKFAGNGSSNLLVSAQIPRTDGLGAKETLFIILDQDASQNYRSAFEWYRNSPTETEGEIIYFAGQFDFDNDGIDELFLRNVLYENYRYLVLKKTRDGWKQVFETEVLGCL